MNKQILLPIAILFTIMTLFLVSGATTLNVPVAGTNYTTITFNCTTTTGECKGCLNASIYYNASGGDSYGDTLLGTITNDTDDDIEFTQLISIESLDDLLTYNFSCYVDNKTDQVLSAGITSVGIDNTGPTVSVTTDYSEITLSRIFKYTTAIADATSGLDGTESCSIVDPLDDSTSVSTSASSVIFEDTGIAGDYNLSCSATDDAGNTNSDSEIIKVKMTGPPIKREADIPIIGDILEKLKGLDRTTWIVIIVIIGVIVLASRKKG